MKYFLHLLIISFALINTCYATDWQTLNASQQEALAPLANEWSKLPENQQTQLIDVASSYHLLNADQKTRLHQRLSTWAKLSPEQRNAARDKYRAFSGVPERTQQEVKEMMKKNKE